MRDPGKNHPKAWAKDYEETPFFCDQKSESGQHRLIVWSEDLDQTKRAFYAIAEHLPQIVDVLLKISIGTGEENRPLWTHYQGYIARDQVLNAARTNERYIFSDGMHQICLKDPDSDRYLAFDDHGILFVYSPLPTDFELFNALGFENRRAKPHYMVPHYQITDPDSKEMELKFIDNLGLEKVDSDLKK